MTPDGAVRVHKLLLAVNCGHAVNPGQIEAQVQGSIVYGLSAALWGENTVEKGRMVQTNFHDYRVLQLSEMPRSKPSSLPTVISGAASANRRLRW